MQKLKHILKILFKPAYILLAVFAIIILGFIGLICLDEYNDRTRESKHQSLREYHWQTGQLLCALMTFPYTVLNINEDLEFDLNEVKKNLEMKDIEIKNLFEVKKLLLEPNTNFNATLYRLYKNHYENLRKESKYLYLNPNIDLWRQYILAAFGGEKFEDKNEFALILCIPQGQYKGQFAKITFSAHFHIFDSLPTHSIPEDWLEPNAEAQKEWEAYERSLSEAGVK